MTGNRQDTVDTDYTAHRQRLPAEQSYTYTIPNADNLPSPALPETD